MAATFTYRTPLELKQIEQSLLPVLELEDPIFDDFPVTEVNSWRLRWEQMDNFIGLQQVRGLNGAPTRVNRVGSKTYDMEPGVYGEFITLDEKEMTERAQMASYTDFIDLNDLVEIAQNQLLTRRFSRVRQIIWTLLATGTFAVAKADGTVLHTDSFTTQSLTAAVPWSTFATATPFADIRAARLKYRGYSVSFGAKSKLYMNSTTANNLLLNTNAADRFGLRLANGATLNDLESVQQVLGANDLPTIVIHDGGYFDDTNTFQLFIPNNKAILVGRRTNGAPVGEYRMVRNAQNPNVEPGPYTRVIDRGELVVPRTVEVHDGHNGGPVLYFGSAIVVLNV